MDEDIRLVVTPKKSIGYYFIRNLGIFIFYLIVLIISLILKLTLFKKIPEITIVLSNILSSFMLYGAIIFSVIYICLTFKMYINTRIIQFVFYDKYVKYTDDFFNRETKTISYDNITEISMRQPIWDRVLGTGTIYLKTPVEHGVGIFMNYIDNPDLIETEVRNLINDKIM